MIRYVIAGVLFLTTSVAHAQIVNVLGKIKAEEGLYGGVGFSLGFKSGNTTLVRAKADVSAGYNLGDHRLLLMGKADFGTKQPIEKLSSDSFDKDNFVHISRVFEHLRYQYRFVDWLWGEAFVQHEADRFRDLGTRFVLGAGPRFHVSPVDWLRLAFGSAYMFEFEDYNQSLVDNATSHRWSNYVQFDAALDEIFSVHNTTYVQVRFAGDRPVVTFTDGTTAEVVSDWRISSESSLVLKVTGWLSVKLSMTLKFNSTTPPQEADVIDIDPSVSNEIFEITDAGNKTVKQLDTGFDSALVVSF